MEAGFLMIPKCETFGTTCTYRYSTHDDFIGKGSYGSVFKATVTDGGNYTGEDSVAVKVVHLESTMENLVNPKNYTQARNRLRSLVNLRHEHLVAYHKVTIIRAVGGVTVELMMEYHDGDLAALLYQLRQSQSLLDQKTAILYAIEITKGVEFLHQNNIIHGDLKPGNVLIKRTNSGQKRLLIGDLDDLVEMQRDMTCTNDITHLRGTIRYMSPEMLQRFATLRNEKPGQEAQGLKPICGALDVLS
ncbi:uncharacterized protein LOC129597261 isoform X2 [Paramacrobiotus metropolitanus]|uniref:uncharacterized protein LOC129597261 isoform X2 n=1 Tax=Paramacrobiotus metropolitanus TaxID=2943436 RepID=UPI0024457DEE|nr:uncharacterized protein LOC129597261 isoform X2 [Paramacrobiotus metropolitanus]